MDKKMNLEGDTVQVGQTGSTTRTLGKLLDSGNEGEVYRIKGSADTVAKIFYGEFRENKRKKVPAMINNEPTDAPADIQDKTSIIWPENVVNGSNGSFLGYSMPYLDHDEVRPVNQYVGEELNWGPSGPEDRYRLARNFALAIDRIHEQGHGVGDWNNDNFLVADDMHVTLIDTDAFHIQIGQNVYEGTSFLPRYTPPEGARDDRIRRVRKADRFSLGVHIFNILMEGIHPYLAEGENAEPGDFEAMIQGNERFPYGNPAPGKLEPHSRAPDYDQLPDKIRERFESCFNRTGKKLGWGRPSAETWAATFAETRGETFQGISLSEEDKEDEENSDTGSGNPFSETKSETKSDNPFSDTKSKSTPDRPFNDTKSASGSSSPFTDTESESGSSSPFTDTESESESDTSATNPFRDEGSKTTSGDKESTGYQPTDRSNEDPWSNSEESDESGDSDDENDESENPFRD